MSAFVHNKSKVNLVRYADDFIVTAATKEIAEEAKGLIRKFHGTKIAVLLVVSPLCISTWFTPSGSEDTNPCSCW